MRKKTAISIGMGGWIGVVHGYFFSLWHTTIFVSTEDIIVAILFAPLLVFFGWQLKDLFKD